jgi:pSer/pThr/pTyr-binding forkhead associated (FHA) protein
MTQPRRRTRRSTREVPAAAEREARLVDKGPGGSPISYTLGRLTTIGRTLRNTIVIPAPDVSRSHARIELTADGFLLSDLGSQNGTFVNDERIKEQVLKPGDEVRIGDQATFVYVMGGPDEDQGNPQE